MITGKTKLEDLVPEGYEIERISDVWGDMEKSAGITITIKKKQKTLDDYENIMLKKSIFRIENEWLKENHSKQYYSIILQMIADDICDKKFGQMYFITKQGTKPVFYENDKPICSVPFDTYEHAEQARRLLGENIKHLL